MSTARPKIVDLSYRSLMRGGLSARRSTARCTTASRRLSTPASCASAPSSTAATGSLLAGSLTGPRSVRKGSRVLVPRPKELGALWHQGF